LTIIGVLQVGIGIGATGHRLLAAPSSFSETPLHRTELPGIDKYELIVSRLETTPGWSHGRYYHEGHEIVYVLEGNGALAVEGKPEQRLQPGTVAYIAPGKVHAGRNASQKDVFKFVLLRLHAKGQPISVELN
jgi:quercetin dioxygenase-like cupin family protein